MVVKSLMDIRNGGGRKWFGKVDIVNFCSKGAGDRSNVKLCTGSMCSTVDLIRKPPKRIVSKRGFAAAQTGQTGINATGEHLRKSSAALSENMLTFPDQQEGQHHGMQCIAESEKVDVKIQKE